MPDTIDRMVSRGDTPGADRQAVDAALEALAAEPLFRDAEDGEIEIAGNPFRRPMRLNDHRFIDFTAPWRAMR
ncbi:MAG: hypothetical protein GVY27_12985 [Deinococcus-Thermus bacterium]|nr:hypothetical protein [Deinococcota bacterium]